jgi:hypothetical protein
MIFFVALNALSTEHCVTFCGLFLLALIFMYVFFHKNTISTSRIQLHTFLQSYIICLSIVYNCIEIPGQPCVSFYCYECPTKFSITNLGNCHLLKDIGVQRFVVYNTTLSQARKKSAFLCNFVLQDF